MTGLYPQHRTATHPTLTRRYAPASPWQGEVCVLCFRGNIQQLSSATHPSNQTPLRPFGGGQGEGEERDDLGQFNFGLQNRTWLRGSLFPVRELVFQEPAVARSLWRRIVSQRRILPACVDRNGAPRANAIVRTVATR